MKNFLPFVFALGTALCWGLYGPVLGRARLVDESMSPFKPYVGIGIAYLVIAIVGGLIGMRVMGDSFEPTGPSGVWGLYAGTLGALGALSLTLAMFSGGARIPYAVMPVVFGGAVTVTALYTLYRGRGQLEVSPLLWVGIAGMLISVVLITTNTPHPGPPGGGHGESTEHAESVEDAAGESGP